MASTATESLMPILTSELLLGYSRVCFKNAGFEGVLAFNSRCLLGSNDIVALGPLGYYDGVAVPGFSPDSPGM